MTDLNEPVWIATLREQCRAHPQEKVAELIGYSPAVVNQVLQRKYGENGHAGNLAKVEKAVRGAFLGETCFCPVLGEIPVNQCMAIQRQPFASTNPQRVRLYRACRAGCENSQIDRRKPVGGGS